MSLSVLSMIRWIFGIRGHIPQNGDFGGGRNESSLFSHARPLTQVVAAFVLVAAFLSLVLWAAVWLAIRFL